MRMTGENKEKRDGEEKTPKAAVNHHQPCGLEAGHSDYTPDILHTWTHIHTCSVNGLTCGTPPGILPKPCLFFECLRMFIYQLHVKRSFRDHFLQNKSQFGFFLSDLLTGSHID